jgi:hypothetical protein
MPKEFLPFLDLSVHGEGITEAEFRGGSTSKRTNQPWPVKDEHKQVLRPILEAWGFDVSKEILAQETVDTDGFWLTQPH